LFIFQFRTWLTWPDLPMRDSSFLKGGHRSSGVQPGWANGATAPGIQSETAKIKVL